jgi:hypothetical protein
VTVELVLAVQDSLTDVLLVGVAVKLVGAAGGAEFAGVVAEAVLLSPDELPAASNARTV